MCIECWHSDVFPRGRHSTTAYPKKRERMHLVFYSKVERRDEHVQFEVISCLRVEKASFLSHVHFNFLILSCM